MDYIKLKLQEEFTKTEQSLAEKLASTPILVKCHEIFNKLLSQKKQSQDKYLALCLF